MKFLVTTTLLLALFSSNSFAQSSATASTISKVAIQVTTCKMTAIRLYGWVWCHDRNEDMIETVMSDLGSQVTLVKTTEDPDAVITIEMNQSPTTGETVSQVAIQLRDHSFLPAISHKQEAGTLNWHFAEAEKQVSALIKTRLGL